MRKYHLKKGRGTGDQGPVLRQVRGRYFGPEGQPIERLSCGHMVAADGLRVNRRRCPQCEAAEEKINHRGTEEVRSEESGVRSSSPLASAPPSRPGGIDKTAAQASEPGRQLNPETRNPEPETGGINAS